LVAQLAVRSVMVVITPEVLNDNPSLDQGPELFPIKTPVSNAAMETLYEAVLPGTARFDVDRLDLVGCEPASDLQGYELGDHCRCAGRRVLHVRQWPVPIHSSTSALFKARSARSTWLSRVYSSRMVSIRRALPRIVASEMKSQLQTLSSVLYLLLFILVCSLQPRLSHQLARFDEVTSP
jgi:hypothetical protein